MASSSSSSSSSSSPGAPDGAPAARARALWRLAPHARKPSSPHVRPAARPAEIVLDARTQDMTVQEWCVVRRAPRAARAFEAS